MKSYALFLLLLIGTLLPATSFAEAKGRRIRQAIYQDSLYIQFRDVRLDLQANGTLNDWSDASSDPQKIQVDGVLIDFFRSVLKDPKASQISLEILQKEYAVYMEILGRYNGLITRIQSDIQAKITYFADFKNLSYKQYGQELKEILLSFKSFTGRLRGYYNKQFINPTTVVSILKIVAKGIEYLAVRSVKRILIEELDNLRINPLDWAPVFAAVGSGLPVAQVTQSIETLENVSLEAQYATALKLPQGGVGSLDEVNQYYVREETRLTSLLGEANLDQDEKDFFEDKLAEAGSAMNWYKMHPPKARTSTQALPGATEGQLRQQVETLLLINEGCVPREQLEKILKNNK